MAGTPNPYADPTYGPDSKPNPYADPNDDGSASIPRRIADIAAVPLAKGAVGLPQAVYGFGDMLTGGLLDRASTAITSPIVKVADALTGNKVSQVYGAGNVGQMFGDANAPPAAPVDVPGTKGSELFAGAQQFLDQGFSADQTQSNEDVANAKGFIPKVAAYATHPSVLAGSIAEMAPSFIGGSLALRGLTLASAGMKAGAAALRLGATEGEAAAASAAARAGTSAGDALTAAGGSAEAGAAADAAATQAVTKFPTSAGGIAAQAGTNAVLSGGQTNLDVKTSVLDTLGGMSEADRMKSPAYAQLRMSMTPDEALNKLATDSGLKAGVVASVGGALAAPIAGGFKGKVATAGLAKDMTDVAVRRYLGLPGLAKSVGSETASNMLFAGSGQLGSNLGRGVVDPTVDPMEGMGGALATGGIMGLGFGLLGHYAGGHGSPDRANADGTVTTADGTTIDPKAGPISAAATDSVLAGHSEPIPFASPSGSDLADEMAAIQRHHDSLEAARAAREDATNIDYNADQAKGAIAEAAAEAARPKPTPAPAADGLQYTPTPTRPPEPESATAATPKGVSDGNDEIQAGNEGGSEGDGKPRPDAGPVGDAAATEAGRNADEGAGGSVVDDGAGIRQARAGDVGPERGSDAAADAGRQEAGHVATVDDAAHDAASSPKNARPEPTDGQIEAGNYAKGHVRLQGLDISIENPHGSTRSSKPGHTPAWSHEVHDHYGYIRGSLGNDGDHLDAYIKKGTPLDHDGPVFVIDQPHPDGSFDEHKFMFGYKSKLEASRAYLKNYPAGHKLGPITETTAHQAESFARYGDTSKPFAEAPQAVERRVDPAARRRVADMSDSEKSRALLTDDLTGLGNRRAMKEAPEPVAHTSIDVDSLKWINDNLGHENGDALLRAVGEAIKGETDRGYHLSGDEFVIHGDSPEEAAAVMARVNDRLAGATLEYTAPDGTVTKIKGIGVSHGIAETLARADEALRAHKADREAAGDRAARGERPSSATVETAEGREAARRPAAPPEVAPAPPVAPAPKPKGPKLPKHASGMIQAIAREGRGVHLDIKSDAGIEKKSKVMIPFFGPLFRRTGMRDDELASFLHEAGYLSDRELNSDDDNGGSRRALEMLRDEIENPGTHLPIGEQGDAAEARAAAEYADHLESEAERLGIDTKGMSLDDIHDAVAAHAVDEHFTPEALEARSDLDDEETAAINSALDAAIAYDQPETDRDAMRRAGITDEEINDVLPQAEGGHGEGEDGEFVAGEPTASRGGDGENSFALTGETEAEARTRLTREAVDRAATEKARAAGALSSDDFVLTGSDRPVDQAEARGQQGLFEPGTDLAKQVAEEQNQLEAKRAKYDPNQLDLFSAPRTEDGQRNQHEGGADPAVRAAPDVRILGHSFVTEIKRVGATALVGRVARSPHEIATLAQVFRDPSYETFRLFFTKDDKIVGSTGVSSRLPGQTPLFPRGLNGEEGMKWVRSLLTQHDADGFHMLHNHPSGDPQASDADIRVTRMMSYYFAEEFKSHVIINSNRYSVIDRRGETQVFARDFGEDKLLVASVKHGFLGKMVDNTLQLADMGKATQRPGWITAIGQTWKGVRIVADMPVEAMKTWEKASAAILDLARRGGSSDIFLAGSRDDLDAVGAKRLNSHGYIIDAVVSDRHDPNFGRSAVGAQYAVHPPRSFGGQVGELVAQPKAPYATDYSHVTDNPAFKRWSNDAPLVTSDAAGSYDFKTGQKVVLEAFHGTARPDRVDARFKKSRATSGPMAYFTADPDIASNYAKGKNDTSLAYEDVSYANWFKFKPEGSRSTVPIDRAWDHLTPEQRSTIGERMPDIRMDDDGNVVYEKDSGGIGNYDWEIKQAKGNALKAATENWLSSGSVFNDEEKFMDVLRLAGFPMKNLTMDFPDAKYPAVYKTFIAMQHPLVVGDIPQSVHDGLAVAAKTDRTRAARGGADMWDKNTRTLRQWVEALNDPTGGKYAWTSIPDKVTAFFRSQGYDGIIDTGGKGGGDKHQVYVPFDEHQVKSAIGNNGRFNPDKKNILYDVSSASNPVFYSALAREIVKAPFSKAGEIDSRMLSNWLAARTKDGTIKRAEVEATGLDDYLKLQGGKLTRDQVQDFVRDNGVKVQDVMLGDKTLPSLPEGWKIVPDEEGSSNFMVVDQHGEEHGYGMTEAEAHESAMDPDARSDAGPKFAGYTLPGGKNYRELLLTLPSKSETADTTRTQYRLIEDQEVVASGDERAAERWRTANPNAIIEQHQVVDQRSRLASSDAGDFRSSHFDQPNILAHVRFNERTDADGKKVLFIEELQSDWAQQGKRVGFRNDQAEAAARANKEALRGELNRAIAEKDEAASRAQEEAKKALAAMSLASYGSILQSGERRADLTAEYRRRKDESPAWSAAIADQNRAEAEITRISQQMHEIEQAGSQGAKVPAGPFVGKTEAWVGLAMKRMIRYAVDHGFDRVAFTNGDQQAARYDLSKQVEQINYRKNDDGTYRVTVMPKDGASVHLGESLTADKVADAVGKDMAEKIVNGEGIVYGERGTKIITGLDLKVGGEGMKAFYDKIIPNVANDVLKKLGGGRVDESVIEQSKPDGPQAAWGGTKAAQPGFDITPKMRDAVLGGQPQFDAATGRGTSNLDLGLHMMASEGTSAQPILERIAKDSTNPLNVVLARALIATGVDSKVEVGKPAKSLWTDPALYKRIAGSYRNSTDTVTITRPANAEKHLLHEIVHAATVEAIDANGLGAQQLKRLIARVRESGLVDEKLYGMSDPYEFIAEAMSNPKFQEVLQNVPLRTGNVIGDAWHGFVKLVARLLGMKDTNALLETMAVGTRLFDETKALKEQARGDRAPGFDAWADRRASVTDTPAFKRFFGNSKVVDANGEPRVMYHATPNDFTDFKVGGDDPTKSGQAIWFGTDAMNPQAAHNVLQGMRVGRFKEGVRTIPAYLSIENPLVVNDATRAAVREKYGFDFPQTITAEQRAQLLADGHDGVMYHYGKGDNLTEVAALHPEQIKSATGNDGSFDPRNPDIRFDQSEAHEEWADKARADVEADPLNAPRPELEGMNLLDKVRQGAGDYLNDPSPLSWWNKTVGTQYQKAMRIPVFKTVFDAGQRYLHDRDFIAARAAESAPSLLPKIDANVVKTIRNAANMVTKADTAKLAGPIFEGTLTDKRTYTDAELRDRFGLNDKQVGQYKEFRQATNQSLDDLMASEAARLAHGKGVEWAIEAGKQDARNAPALIAEALRGHGFDEIANTIEQKAGRVRGLQQEGYAPLSRFGQHTVYAVGPNGEQLFFGMYESKKQANVMQRQLKAAHPEAVVTRGEMSQKASELFRGVSPDTLDLFADALGADDKEVYQQYLQRAINNRSTLKRMIERKGIAGFSEDVPRVLSTFVSSNAKTAASNYHMRDMTAAADAVPKELGAVKDDAVALVKYLQNQGNEAGAVRGLLFTNFIGGSVASALTNLTQPVLQTLPYLTQWGATKAASAMAFGTKVALHGASADKDLAAAMERALHEGVIGSPETSQLFAAQNNGLGSHPIMRTIGAVWGAPFAASEAFNRRLTFAASYEIGRGLSDTELGRAGVKDAFEFAAKSVAETQGVYNAGNRPNWARGAVGATLFTFKQFSVQYLEFIQRLPPKQKAIALATLVMAAGTQGLPFASDIEDIIDTIGQSLGYDTNSKRAWREGAVNAAMKIGLPAGVGKFFNQGISSVPGVPIDTQGRLGMSSLIPGAGMFKRSTSTDDKQAALLEVLGPIGQFVQNVSQAVAKGQAGDWIGAAKIGAPLAVQNALKAVDMMQTGAYRDGKGRIVAKTTTGDAVAKGIGFSAPDVSLQSEKVSEFYQQQQINSIVKDQIIERWARGAFENDPAQVRDATDALRSWNTKNPDNIIKIAPTAIHTRVQSMALTQDQRTIKGAPAQLRGDAVATLR